MVRELIQQIGIEGCGGERCGLHALALAARNQHLDVVATLANAGIIDSGEALRVAAGRSREASVKLSSSSYGSDGGGRAP